MTKKLKSGTILYWKRKSELIYNKSWIQEIIETSNGRLLALNSRENNYTKYPTFILVKDIDIAYKIKE